MNLFPVRTSNKNVPPNVLLLCEISQCSGEIITTTWATDTGRIMQATDWVNDKPHQVHINDVAREMGYAPIAIMERIVKWSSVVTALEEARKAVQA